MESTNMSQADLHITPNGAATRANVRRAVDNDPILARIERRRAAWQKASAENENLTKEMVDAHVELYDLIQATTPTTMAGHVAGARYLLVETIANGMDAGKGAIEGTRD